MDNITNMDLVLNITNITLKYFAGFPIFRQTTGYVAVYCVAYGLVFMIGIVGNVFVVISVAQNPAMRSVTNYLITSLAAADLLICVFSLPATLLNNILTEWYLGNVMCKLQVWISGLSVCASVYTLVAVSADRYLAICHTFLHKRFNERRFLTTLAAIWTLSSLIFLPWPMYYREVAYPVRSPPNVYPNITYASICFAPEFRHQKWFFLVSNLILAFLIPLGAIIFLYGGIFFHVMWRRRGAPLAIDKGAHVREHRLRLRTTIMMLAVIVSFAFCWLPLYSLFTVLNFGSAIHRQGHRAVILNSILRPLFQWLSLANSCINPILYAYFSSKFRQAFYDIIVFPCRRKVSNFKRATQATLHKYSSYSSFSGRRKRPLSKAISEDVLTHKLTDNPATLPCSSRHSTKSLLTVNSARKPRWRRGAKQQRLKISLRNKLASPEQETFIATENFEIGREIDNFPLKLPLYPMENSFTLPPTTIITSPKGTLKKASYRNATNVQNSIDLSDFNKCSNIKAECISAITKKTGSSCESHESVVDHLIAEKSLAEDVAEVRLERAFTINPLQTHGLLKADINTEAVNIKPEKCICDKTSLLNKSSTSLKSCRLRAKASITGSLGFITNSVDPLEPATDQSARINKDSYVNRSIDDSEATLTPISARHYPFRTSAV